MKKVAYLLLLIPSLAFSQLKVSVNTDLASVCDSCIRTSFSGAASINFDFTGLINDTTELSLYRADWDKDNKKWIPTLASDMATFPVVLDKSVTTYQHIFDVDSDDIMDTTYTVRFEFLSYKATGICWKTAKQDSGYYHVYITK